MNNTSGKSFGFTPKFKIGELVNLNVYDEETDEFRLGVAPKCLVPKYIIGIKISAIILADGATQQLVKYLLSDCHPDDINFNPFTLLIGALAE